MEDMVAEVKAEMAESQKETAATPAAGPEGEAGA